MVKKRRKHPRSNHTTLWVILLFLVGVAALIWWFRPYLFPASPEFNYLVIEKNGQSLKLVNGEVLHLNPRDTLRIKKISSNRILNRGFRLFSDEFDVNAFLHDSLTVSDLLPDGDAFGRYSFQVDIKYQNLSVGQVKILVEPDLEDWLAKADRTIDPARKIAILEKAMDIMPGNAQLRAKLLEAYKSQQKWSEAALMLEKMEEENPEENILNDLLETYEAIPDRDGVVSVLKRLVKLDPEDVERQLQLARLLEESKKSSEAVSVYEAALEKLEEKDRIPVYKTLGYLYTQLHQPQKAISSYLKALEKDQNDVNLYYNLANLYEKSGQQGQADSYLAKALDLQTEDLGTRLALAERLIKRGDLKKAEIYVSEVLKKRPDSLEALSLMIPITEAKKDKGAMISLYRKILSLNPKNETIIYNLGVLEYESGHLADSASYFKEYVTRHPKDKESHTFLFDIYKKQKKWEAAFSEAQTLVALDPKETSPYFYIFDYFDNRGEYEKMIEVTKEGLKTHPNNTQMREYLVVAYLKTGKDDLALKEMQKILTARPKDVPLLLQTAKLQEKQGNWKGALETYKKVLDLVPGHEEAEEAYLRLRLKALPRE